MLAASTTIGKNALNPYEPNRFCRSVVADAASVGSDGSSLSRFIVKAWYLLPLVFAVFFMLPVLIFGLLDRNLNPLDVNSMVFQGLVNFVVGGLSGFFVVAYVRYRSNVGRLLRAVAAKALGRSG